MQFKKDQIKDIYFLTPMQEGMLFHTIQNQNENAYLNQLIFSIEGNLDSKRLENSFNELLKHHDALRTIFVYEKVSRPIQIVINEASVSILEKDLSLFSEEERKIRIQDFLSKDRMQRFDLSSNIPMRITLIKLKHSEYKLIWSHHHLLIDGWCLGLLVSELLETYKRKPLNIKEITPFSEYIKWISKQEASLASEYWNSYLAGYGEQALLPQVSSLERGNFESKYLKFFVDEDITSALKKTAIKFQTTLNIIFQVAWGILLQRYNNTNDVVYGAVRSGRQAEIQGIDEIIGLLINTVPVRIITKENQTIEQLIKLTQQDSHNSRSFDYFPLYKIQADSELKQNLINHIIVFENYPIGKATNNFGVSDLDFNISEFNIIEQTNYDLSVTVIPTAHDIQFLFQFNEESYSEETISQIGERLLYIIEQISKNPSMHVNDIDLYTEKEYLHIFEQNLNRTAYEEEATIVELFERQVDTQPEGIAYICGNESLTYFECNQKANQVANELINRGVQSNDVVGLLLDRSFEMVIGMLGILKAGAAYLPLDPSYPQKRIDYMLEDSGSEILLSKSKICSSDGFKYKQELILLDNMNSNYVGSNPVTTNDNESLAYVIYTSGSTGKPKGVMITHKNVVNFFQGMNTIISPNNKDSLLSVTSISFDISVLELLWTVVKGIQVTIQTENQKVSNYDQYLQSKKFTDLDFSLFFFSSYKNNELDNKYEFLLEAAKYADNNKFKAVWTPERHFHNFGGLYSNPSITSAAISSITKNIHIRGGSIVSPLHDSIRIAEDWSIIDNISNGRIGLAFAPGWHPNDFVYAPENYQQRKEIMYEQINEVRELWSGGSIDRENGLGETVSIKTYPRPIQKDIPYWITTSGTEETFKKAGEIGANVLTHLLGQDSNLLAQNIAIYRKALSDNGYDPHSRKVTVMLHTYIGEDLDDVKALIKEPFCEYLRSNFSLIKKLEDETSTQNTMEQIIEKGFERYWNTAALLGTEETCFETVKRLYHIGADEIASLVDFGLDLDLVMKGLEKLTALKGKFKNYVEENSRLHSKIHKITMMQTTPSRLKALVEDKRSHMFLSQLKKIMVGGEAFPPDLMKALTKTTSARIFNMYGPTETTIWSSVKEMTMEKVVTVGKPINNTSFYIFDKKGRLLPKGVQGELYIAGAGVAKGYFNRPTLTNEKFIYYSFKEDLYKERLYRTGDIARYLPNGEIELLGREDDQVKVRGFRIELGEIEKYILSHSSVKNAVVLGRLDEFNNTLIVGYIVWQDDEQISELKPYIQGYLPEYMIPNLFVSLNSIPLTSNGKIDRVALRENQLVSSVQLSEYDAPTNALEEKLMGIWLRILGLEQISVNDNFFEIGGHSLLAVKLEVELSKIDITNMDLAVFQFNTIRKLAEEIKRRNV